MDFDDWDASPWNSEKLLFQVELMLVPELSDYGLDLSHLSLTIQLNASLAIQLTTAWMKLKYDSNGGINEAH